MKYLGFKNCLSVCCSFYKSLMKVYVGYYPLALIKTVYSVKCHGLNPSMTKRFCLHLKLGSSFFRTSLCLFTILEPSAQWKFYGVIGLTSSLYVSQSLWRI